MDKRKPKKVKGSSSKHDLNKYKESPYETFELHYPALILHFKTKYLIGGLIRRYKQHYNHYSNKEIKKFINVHIDEELSG